MHIEPGIVHGAKILLSYGTVALSIGFLAKESLINIKHYGSTSFLVKSVIASLFVFLFFEVLPHFPVGVSEVHFIFGSTLLLLFGLAPAAAGLVLGLLGQGILFAPSDLPQYSINVTTLLAPLFAMAFFAEKKLPKYLAYKDLCYGDVLKLSVVYQGGIIAWVAFWVFYGKGFGEENLVAVYTFSLAYISVVMIEPLIGLALLFCAKQWSKFDNTLIFEKRLHHSV